MSRDPRDIQTMVQLSDMIFASRQMKMSTLRAVEAELRGRITAIYADRDARGRSFTGDDPAHLAGADLLWHGWIDTRRTALNETLAKNLAAQEAARAGLLLAFGRMQASKSLALTARQARARAVASRNDRGF